MTLAALARPVENCSLAHTRAGTEDESATSMLVFTYTHRKVRSQSESAEKECKAVRLRGDQRLVSTAETCSSANYACFHLNWEDNSN